MAMLAVGLGGLTAPPDLSQLIRRPAWMRDALCLEYQHLEWVPPSGGNVTASLRAVCASCLVTERCLAYALDHPDLVGVWGGTTAQERRKLRQGRSVLAAGTLTA